MADGSRSRMALGVDSLNNLDIHILDLLAEGRATPALIREELAQSGEDYSRQYVNQRMKRFEEHGHVQNLRNTGVYELTDDPRE